MGRTLKYFLTILLVIAVAMWLLTVYRSCKATTDNTEQTTSVGASDMGTDTDGTSLDDLYEDDEEDAGVGETAGENGLESNNNGDTSTDTTEDDGSVGGGDEEETPSEFEQDDEVSVSGGGIHSNGGEYLVVAGAFVSKSNAKRYQKQLARRSYDSEIRVFLGSDYHSVIIGAYASRSEAASIAEKIGSEAYVHKKRYPKKRRR